MKKLLAILILIFTFQTPSWADDIRDFEIEGMSIRDSFLDYLSKKEIEKRKSFYKESKSNPKKFAFIDLDSDDLTLEVYDQIKVDFKNSDSKYKIYALGGIIFYKDNINDCYKKKDTIVTEISQMFKETRKDDAGTQKHFIDKSGKSKTTDFIFWFKSGDFVVVSCYDWSKKYEKKGNTDHLRLGIVTKEYHDWLWEQ